MPTAGEVEWARFASATPHYVLSNTLTTADWPKVKFLRSMADLSALMQQDGRDIYLMGGATIAASAIDAGIVDELRLIVYPLIVGEGSALFATPSARRALELRSSEQLPDGTLSFVYGIGRD